MVCVASHTISMSRAWFNLLPFFALNMIFDAEGWPILWGSQQFCELFVNKWNNQPPARTIRQAMT
jgi:hypothetical protein